MAGQRAPADSTLGMQCVTYSPRPASDLKPFTARLADYLVLAKVRQALGFAKCQKSFYGAAPMAADTQHFFLGLNMRLYSGYGLSETSGPHFMSSPRNYRLYRCVCGGALAPQLLDLGARVPTVPSRPQPLPGLSRGGGVCPCVTRVCG